MAQFAGRGDTYASRIPQVVPGSLDDLTGPRTGVVELPQSIHSGPDRRHDLGDPDDRRLLYERVLREATAPGQLTELLDKDLLIELWPAMVLPERCTAAWQERFPALLGGRG